METNWLTSLCYISPAGYQLADYPAIQSGYIASYQTIYPSDAYLNPDSQDYQWLSITSQAIYDVCSLGNLIYLSFSPQTATGQALSNNVLINGLTRGIATYSSVDVVIVGSTGTVITNGQATDVLGQQWNLPSSVTIPLSGTITVTALANSIGAIYAESNTITTINTPTLGWLSVNNPTPAVPGTPIQTDAQLSLLQSESTMLSSLGILDGMLGAIAGIPGVTEFQGYTNPTNTTDSNGLPPFNIAIVVQGGDAQTIGNTIAIYKNLGTPTYGTTSVTTYDQYGNANVINFYRPTPANISVAITATALPGYLSTTIPLIQQAVADYINALPIGATIYITKVYNPANLENMNQGSTFDITSLQMEYNSDGFTGNNIVLAFNEQAVCIPSNVSVTVT